MIWEVGVTTVPKRKHDLLPRTLASLKAAGFTVNRLYVDGDADPKDWSLPASCRGETILPYGNWILALAEMLIRNPDADRYAIFQDDLVAVRNLREYLEECPYPRGYLNLYTFPDETRELAKRIGWHPSTQRGKGALGLVFDRDMAIEMATHQHMVDRPMNPIRGWRLIDGGVIQTTIKLGLKEYVHHPSLIQHTGRESSFDKAKGAQGSRHIYPKYLWAEKHFANPWMGEEFDARKFRR